MSNNNNKRSMSMKTKWIITGILCVLAVLTVVVVAADGCFDFKPGSVKSNNKDIAESSTPENNKDMAKSGGTHTVLVTAGNGNTDHCFGDRYFSCSLSACCYYYSATAARPIPTAA